MPLGQFYLLPINNLCPGEEEISFLCFALNELACSYDGHPGLNVSLVGAALLAKEVEVVVGGLLVLVKAEYKVASCYVGRCVTTGSVRPVDNVGSAVLGDDDVRGAEVAVKKLSVLGHTLKS